MLFSPVFQKFLKRVANNHTTEFHYPHPSQYKNRFSIIDVVCPIHGSFTISARLHQDIGCPNCRDDIKSEIRSMGNPVKTQLMIERFREVHGNRFDYSEMSFVQIQEPVIIICPVHGRFSQTPHSHERGGGCPKCYYDSMRSNSEDVIRRFIEVHGNLYDYSLVEYVDMHTPVKIICPEHGVFLQKPQAHLILKRGCTKCACNISSSGTRWLNSLGISTLIHEYRLPEDSRIPVDGYDPVTNTIYQFHGDYWHGNPKCYSSEDIHKQTQMTMGQRYERTLRSDQQLRDWGYNLVVMWESDFVR